MSLDPTSYHLYTSSWTVEFTYERLKQQIPEDKAWEKIHMAWEKISLENT